MLKGIAKTVDKTQVTLHIPVDVARAMKVHCMHALTHSLYATELIRADLKLPKVEVTDGR